MYQFIKSERQGSTQLITIDREDKMNALTIGLIQEIGQEIERIQTNPEIRGVILTGSGQKAFAAGADISEFSDFSSAEAKEMSANGHAVFNSIEQSSKPIVAAVNGFSLGGGCELAMACHVRIASENAKFGQPEVNLGVPPGYGGTQRLAQIVGKGRALDLLISARAIDAQTALNYGLVTQVVEIDSLLETCTKYLNKLEGKSPLAIAEVIKCTNALYDITDGFEYEIDSFSKSFETPDFKEGTAAFIEKRKPNYS
ncbi:MAG: enoyl-CoA hydratase/isomerase family protein [Bacteroidia bacterium]